LPDAPWLSTNWLRDWVLPVPAPPDPATAPRSWCAGPLAALWAERDALRAAVEALPPCLPPRSLGVESAGRAR